MNAEEYAELTRVEEAEKKPTEALAVLDKSKAIQVFDQTTLTVANNFLRDVKEFKRRIDDKFKANIARWDAGHKAAVAEKREWTDPLDEAERAIKPKITAYLVEQDNIRLEAERAAERARRQVEKEAEAAADAATALINEGKAGEADALIDEATAKIREINADTPFVPEKPVANGTTLRETWDYEIVDADLIPKTFLVPDLTMIRRYGQNMKHQASIPGIRFFAVKSISAKVGKY